MSAWTCDVPEERLMAYAAGDLGAARAREVRSTRRNARRAGTRRWIW